MKIKNRILIAACIILVTVAWLPIVANGQFFFFLEDPLVGEQAPDFSLNTLNSKNVNMTEFRDGQSAIIFFWATWCPHCRRELTELQEKKDEFDQKGVKVMLVDMGEAENIVRTYLENSKIDFEVFLDVNRELADSYNVGGIPTLILLNSDGIVVSVEHSLPEDYAEILTDKTSQNKET